MSDKVSIIEDMDSKKRNKINSLNNFKGKSLAYYLDKFVSAYKVNFSEYIFTILILFLILPHIFCQNASQETVINGNFKACSNSYHKNMIDFNNLCKNKPNRTNHIVKDYLGLKNSDPSVQFWRRKLYLLGKLEHQVYGNGYHCLMKRHILITSMSFWGEKFESFRTEVVKLSKEECKIMVMSKKCGKYQMECDGEYCSYNANPVPTFSWLNQKEIETFSCSLSPKLITAKNSSDHLFGLNCLAKDLFCSLHDSIIIWDKAIFHECPLYKIGYEYFTFDIKSNSDILISDSNLAVQASGNELICNLSVLLTVEGIYLSVITNPEVTNKIPQSLSVEEMKELLLAENDYRIYEDIKQKNEMLFNECQNFKTVLSVFSKTEDKFFTHYLKDGSSITFYSTMGTLYKADCINVNQIKLITDTRKENSSICFADQPVTFQNKNLSRNGFLTNDGIIKQISDLVPCNRVTQYIQLVDKNETIVRINYQSMIMPNSRLQFYKFDYLGNKIRELEIHHNPLLLDGIDLLSTFQDVINHELSAGTWYTHMSETSNIKAKIIETKFEIENGLNYTFNKAIGAIGAIFFCFIMVIILFLACNYWIKCCKYRILYPRNDKLWKRTNMKRKKKNRDQLDEIVEQPIEMINLKSEYMTEQLAVPLNHKVNDSYDSFDSFN